MFRTVFYLSLVLRIAALSAVIALVIACGDDSEPGELVFTLINNGTAYSVSAATEASRYIIPAFYNGLPVTAIGDYAFSDCSRLISISLPTSLTSIGDGAFSGCTNLRSISIPSSVTSIGDGAFYNCSSFNNINLPTGLTSIGWRAFYLCDNLNSISIPASVTSIGLYAFAYCESLKNITVDLNNPFFASQGGMLFNKAKTELIAFPSASGEVSLPAGLILIGEWAFFSCISLKSISLPDSLTSIDEWAFYNCTSLSSISLPNSLTSIGWGAFYLCDNLNSITIPGSVIFVSGIAFSNCPSLQTIYIEGSTSGWNSRWRDGCNAQVFQWIDGEWVKI